MQMYSTTSKSIVQQVKKAIQSHFWVYISFTHSGSEKCTRNRHQPPTAMEQQEITHLCVCGDYRAHTQTSTYIHAQSLQPHTHMQPQPHVHISSQAAACNHAPSIAYLCFTDNSVLEQKHCVSDLWAASQAGAPVGYHDTAYQRETEIGAEIRWQRQKAWGIDKLHFPHRRLQTKRLKVFRELRFLISSH